MLQVQTLRLMLYLVEHECVRGRGRARAKGQGRERGQEGVKEEDKDKEIKENKTEATAKSLISKILAQRTRP